MLFFCNKALTGDMPHNPLETDVSRNTARDI